MAMATSCSPPPLILTAAATFDYTVVSDGNGGAATQTVSVDVTAVNDAPNVDMTSPVSLSVAEDGTLLINEDGPSGQC